MSPSVAPSSRRKVLFTGALGRVGERVIPALERDYEIHATDLRAPESPGPGSSFTAADLLDFDQTLALCEGKDAVVHSAIASSRDFGVRDDLTPQEEMLPFDLRTIDVNVRATYHLFEAARRQKVKQIVYISSLTTILGIRKDFFPADHPDDPANLYACTKLFGEHLGRVYSRRFGISVICLRLGQPFPIGVPQEADWVKSPRARAFFTAAEDIAAAIDCSLRHPEVPFGIYPLVSHAEPPRIDLSRGKEIGFEPRYTVDEAGHWHPRPVSR